MEHPPKDQRSTQQRSKLLAVPVLAALLGLAACGGSNDGKNGANASSTPTAAATPTGKVSFVDPKSGATTSKVVIAKVKLVGFKLDAADVGMAAAPGVGHLHFSLDGGKFDLPQYSGANGQLAKKLGVDGKYSPSVTPTITYRGLPAGQHTLRVELANNDHSPAGASAETTFTVQ
ncbi:MAG: hypothetical protein QOG09_1829 [Solirubrobacterales bacterium]|jgi:hypothetical protein|nr:hypothetical protein [Solirubrobacterales bacterium]